MHITILTLFPEYFDQILKTSMLGKAIESGLVSVTCVNIRDKASLPHRITDDRPYGGGAGMVMKVEPIVETLESLPYFKQSHTVLLSASGSEFTQENAKDYAKLENLILICGHYEGVDHRVSNYISEEKRIGNYVLTGGEPAAAVIIDAVARLVEGVLGNPDSLIGESHSKIGQGGYPQYTRPAVFRDQKVPEVLQAGNHKKIEEWREANRKKELDRQDQLPLE